MTYNIPPAIPTFPQIWLNSWVLIPALVFILENRVRVYVRVLLFIILDIIFAYWSCYR